MSLVAAAVLIGGCVKTSRVDDAVTSGTLATTRKAVALMRIGSASPNCVNVAVLLGRAEGDGYRRVQPITVANERSLTESPVAEVELEPGEYHVIGYSCHTDKGNQMVFDPASGTLFRTSYARFKLEAGEIVNVGYFKFIAHNTRSTFGGGVRADVEITDWPLPEIERFRRKRPALFAQMTTRLMTLGISADQQADACVAWAKLKADHKVQDVPPACGGAGPEKTKPHR